MSQEVYAARRAEFMRRMGELANGPVVAVLRSAPVMHKTADQDFAYRQDSDFHYLTGYPEPDAVAILTPGAAEDYVLFVRPRDPERETWDGRRAGVEGAVSKYGAKRAFPVDEVREKLPGLLDRASSIFYSLNPRHGGKDEAFTRVVLEAVDSLRTKQRGGAAPDSLVDPGAILHEMRLRKAPDEVALMRRAAEVAAEAHCQAMRVCRPGVAEYELQAEIEYVFRKRGTMGPAYGSIVGGGENATILHYHENCDTLRDGDLVLIDAGAEVAMYASDITRTFPVNGRFSAAQREVYSWVLRANEEAIDRVRAGNHFREPHNRALEVLVEGMVAMGWLQGDVATLIEKEAYRPFFMHGTSHWLGMDVHDVGRYKQGDDWRPLEPGMVLTVEPGLYVSPGAKGVPERYWGIGVRIEDDVMVTSGDPEVFTTGVPKAVDAIEALMAGDRTPAPATV